MGLVIDLYVAVHGWGFSNLAADPLAIFHCKTLMHAIHWLNTWKGKSRGRSNCFPTNTLFCVQKDRLSGLGSSCYALSNAAPPMHLNERSPSYTHTCSPLQTHMQLHCGGLQIYQITILWIEYLTKTQLRFCHQFLSCGYVLLGYFQPWLYKVWFKTTYVVLGLW